MKQVRYIGIVLLFAYGPWSQAAELVGSVDWANQRMLAFQVTGLIERVAAQPGERIQQGQELARLDQQPFQIAIKKHQASVEALSPLLDDARREYEHAQELFDQTVLSEVELQKKKALMVSLQAQKEVAKQELALSRWQQKRSILIAPASVQVIASNLLPGMVISDYHQAHVLVSDTSLMAIRLTADIDQRTAFSIGQDHEVKIGRQRLNAKVSSITIKGMEPPTYKVVLQFKPDTEQQYFAGQQATVVY